MTDDIPEHLIEAYESSDDYSDEHPVERILAALRPEDAPFIPALYGPYQRWVQRSAQLAEARAEVERLKTENTRLREALRGAAERLRWAGMKSIDDDYERGKRHAEDDIKRQMLRLADEIKEAQQ